MAAIRKGERTLTEITKILRKGLSIKPNTLPTRARKTRIAVDLAQVEEPGFGRNHQVFKNTAIRTDKNSFQVLIAARKATRKEDEFLLEEDDDTNELDFYGKSQVVNVICNEKNIPISVTTFGKSKTYTTLDPNFLLQLQEINPKEIPSLEERLKNDLLSGHLKSLDRSNGSLILRVESNDKAIICDNRDGSDHCINLRSNPDNSFTADLFYLKQRYEKNIQLQDFPISLTKQIKEKLEKETVLQEIENFLADNDLQITASRNDSGFVCTTKSNNKNVNEQNTLNLVFNTKMGNNFTVNVQYYGFDLNVTVPATLITQSIHYPKLQKALKIADENKFKELLGSDPQSIKFSIDETKWTYTATFMHAGRERTITGIPKKDIPVDLVESLISSK